MSLRIAAIAFGFFCAFALAADRVSDNRGPRTPKQTTLSSTKHIPTADMTLDYSNDFTFGLTVTDRDGGVLGLDFVWNAEDERWDPVFSPDAGDAIMGADLESWAQRVLPLHESPLRSIVLGPSIVKAPHDDITGIAMPEQDLVLVCLWQGGDVAGIYHAFRPSQTLRERYAKQQEADSENPGDGEVAGRGPWGPGLCYAIDCY